MEKTYEIIENALHGLYINKQTTKKIIIGIDGLAAAGKTTMAEKLATKFSATLIHMDHFFLTDTLRSESRLQEIGGHVDYARFSEEVLPYIHENHDLTYHIYDCVKKTMFLQHLTNHPLVIIEGAYAHHPYFSKSLYDLKIVLTADEATQQKRILNRNPAMYERFLHDFIPKEKAYIAQFSIDTQADLLLDTSDSYN